MPAVQQGLEHRGDDVGGGDALPLDGGGEVRRIEALAHEQAERVEEGHQEDHDAEAVREWQGDEAEVVGAGLDAGGGDPGRRREVAAACRA